MKKNAIAKVKVGDVIVNTWGYEQTNVDYYQVTRKTKKQVYVKAISSDIKEDQQLMMQGKSYPVLNSFVGEELRKEPYEYDNDGCLAGQVWFNFEYGTGQLWNGKPVRVSWYA